MRSKSFPVRSRPRRASLNSLDPYPSPASFPGESNGRFTSGVSTPHCDNGDAAHVETVPDTVDERDVPSKKRPCIGTSETTGGGGSSVEACIVCDILDEGVSRCSGTDCLLWFHWECLNPDLDSSSEDLAKTYCSYCWYKVLVMRHKSAKEKAVGAEKEVSKCISKETKSRDEVEESVPKGQEDTTLNGGDNRNQDHSVDRADIVRDQELRGGKDVCSSEKEQLQVEKDSDRSREEDMPLTEERDFQPQEDTEKFQDAEEDKDEETTKDQTGAGGKGDVSPFVSGEEQDLIQQNEMSRRRRRRLILHDTDSDISSDESTNERNGEDVSEQITSPAQVQTSPSGTMKNQQRKHSSTTKVDMSKTVRDISSFKMDQRKRLFWTPEEEEMLKVGVEKFSAEAKKNMPWRKILEMGEEVFHETRTPADLKDKWRNMMGARGKKTN